MLVELAGKSSQQVMQHVIGRARALLRGRIGGDGEEIKSIAKKLGANVFKGHALHARIERSLSAHTVVHARAARQAGGFLEAGASFFASASLEIAAGQKKQKIAGRVLGAGGNEILGGPFENRPRLLGQSSMVHERRGGLTDQDGGMLQVVFLQTLPEVLERGAQAGLILGGLSDVSEQDAGIQFA